MNKRIQILADFSKKLHTTKPSSVEGFRKFNFGYDSNDSTLFIKFLDLSKKIQISMLDKDWNDVSLCIDSDDALPLIHNQYLVYLFDYSINYIIENFGIESDEMWYFVLNSMVNSNMYVELQSFINGESVKEYVPKMLANVIDKKHKNAPKLDFASFDELFDCLLFQIK